MSDDHALARRLDEYGQTTAKRVDVPSELLREAAFEMRELAKERDTIARLSAALAEVKAQRCGSCRWWKASCCLNVDSRCYGLLAIPSDFGCPHWRQREEA